MKNISRRSAIKKISTALWVVSSCGFMQPLLSGCSRQEPAQELVDELQKRTTAAQIQNIKLSVVYDNVHFDRGLISDWGFSCYIEGLDKTLLFDTGKHDKTLIANMASMGLDPKSIDKLIISHDHEDHIAGALAICQNNPGMDVSLVSSFRGGFKKAIRRLGATVTEFQQPGRISHNCMSTGELKNFTKNEHALVILSNKGVIVITGCAHPGIVDIVERAKFISGREILLVMGGFHLLLESSSSTRKIAVQLKDLGVQHVAPSHCSGSEASSSFAEVFGKRYIESGVGRVISSQNLI